MNTRSTQKLAMITGATRGLGREIARTCAARDFRLALLARDAAGLESLAAELRAAHGTQTECVPCDLAEPGSAKEGAMRVMERAGTPDVLVNNAGIGWWRPFLEHTTEDHDRMIDLNFRAIVHGVHTVLPRMVRRGSGHIVNIASDLADRPLGNMSVYTATKYALRGFSLSLSQEVRPLGVKVTLVNPGMIDTAFHGSDEGTLDERSALKPEPLAQLVVTLMEQPDHQVIDELQVHAMGQDY